MQKQCRFISTVVFGHNIHLRGANIVHSKRCWVVLTQLWVKYDMNKPSRWVKFLHYIFKPTFGFVHVRPKIG